MKRIVLLMVCIACCASIASAQCPAGLVDDCNGHCVPLAWAQDDICDNGDPSTEHEYPEGSGYYADFSCEDYFCDFGNCEGCVGGCPAGEVTDCFGNCAPVAWFDDGICDYGQREYNGVAIVFACQNRACDLNDCTGPCHQDGDYNGVDDPGACCISSTCGDSTRGDCWDLGGTFMGANTLCQTGTCGCGDGWIADCNGNCFEYAEFSDGGECVDGALIDDGDGGYFELDVDCEALACGLSTCLGECPGGCCIGGGCETTSTYQSCLDLGGLFLGSYVFCEGGAFGCADQQKPIQLPNSELEWSGDLGEVEFLPQWLGSGGNILIAGGTKRNVSWDMVTAVCVFRYDDDQWVEEALLETTGISRWDYTSYSTDGNRIAVGSEANDGTSKGMVIDIFVYNSKTDAWDLEQTINDGYASEGWHLNWGGAIVIEGNTLIVGDSSLNNNGDNNGGGGHVYKFEGDSWNLEQTLLPFGTPPYPEGEDQYLGMSVTLEGDIVALSSTSSLLIFDISTNPASEVQHIRNMWGNNLPRHHSTDFDNGRIMSNAVYNNFDGSILVSKIFESIAGVWTQTAELKPFDVTGLDNAGHIVELDGNRAMITSPKDSDLGLETGSAYIWEYDGTDWIFQAKLWSDRAVGGDLFGISGTLNGSNAYLSGQISEQEGDNIKEFWPRGIAWINPLGGFISTASNWDPTMPTASDSVSFSLRSQTEISVDSAFPFGHLFVGPGSYNFDLSGMDRDLGDGGETINLQGVPGFDAEFILRGGTLSLDGEIHIGEGDLPGKVALISNDLDQVGRLLVDGLYLQHDAGELLLELNTGHSALIQITSVSPQLDGVLSLSLADGYIPEDGDIIPLLTSEVVDENAGQFSMVMVNDPMPEGLYIKLNYEGGGEAGGSGSISAEVELLSNLFGYGEPNSGTVTGSATDVILTDLGSPTRTLDGYDDVVVTTTDSLYIFLSDGAGGFTTQVIYNHADYGFTSLAAVDDGDLDGNGTNDLVVVNSTTNEFIPIFNSFNDISSLSVGDPVSTGPFPTDVLVINTDTDGDDDVIVACYGYSFTDGRIDFFESTLGTMGSFMSSGSMSSPGNPGKINPGDVNNDKDFKLFVSFGSNNTVGSASKSSGVRTFTWEYVAMANVAIGPSNIVIGDLDNDSIDDVVVACPESDVLTLLKGNIDGSFSNSLYLFVGQEPTSIELLDFDNDGDLDIAVVARNPQTDERAVMMYRNDTSNNGGNVMFANDATYDDGANPILVAKGDIDGDGHDDLISIIESSSFRSVTNDVHFRQSETATECRADFDGNGQVNILDLLDLIGAWGATGTTPQDLNDDSTVTVLDLLILIGAWGPC